MAVRLQELNPNITYKRVITPTGDELPEMLEHWKNLSELLGPLTIVTCGASLTKLVYDLRMLPNWRARWCTRQLKIEPYQAWLVQHSPCISYVGLRADEESRSGMEFREDIPGVKLTYPMKEWGWTLKDVRTFLSDKNISIPARTDCGACFFQTLGEWWTLWKEKPERYQEYVDLEAWVSETRGKPCTLRSASRDTWSAGLGDLRLEFEGGRIPRNIKKDSLNTMKCRVCSL